MRGIRKVAEWTFAIVIALMAGSCMGRALSVVTHAEAAPTYVRTKDIVFVGAPGCKGGVVDCAQMLYFNDDWRGVTLCRGRECHQFEDIFKETR